MLAPHTCVTLTTFVTFPDLYKIPELWQRIPAETKTNILKVLSSEIDPAEIRLIR
jgi:hypothetical protein